MSTTSITAALDLDADQQVALLRVGDRFTWDVTGGSLCDEYFDDVSKMIDHADLLTTAAHVTLAARAGVLPTSLHDRVRSMLPACLNSAREAVADRSSYTPAQQQEDAQTLKGLETLAGMLLAGVTA